jgi:hypothetical protein
MRSAPLEQAERPTGLPLVARGYRCDGADTDPGPLSTAGCGGHADHTAGNHPAPVIGHFREDGHLDRNLLASASDGGVDMILAAADHSRLRASRLRLLVSLPTAPRRKRTGASATLNTARPPRKIAFFTADGDDVRGTDNVTRAVPRLDQSRIPAGLVECSRYRPFLRQGDRVWRPNPRVCFCCMGIRRCLGASGQAQAVKPSAVVGRCDQGPPTGDVGATAEAEKMLLPKAVISRRRRSRHGGYCATRIRPSARADRVQMDPYDRVNMLGNQHARGGCVNKCERSPL